MATVLDSKILSKTPNKPELPRVQVKVTEAEYDEDGECLKEQHTQVSNAKDAIQVATGSHNEDFSTAMFRQLIHCLPLHMREDEEGLNAALAMIHCIAPQDELEIALAAEMVAVHHASLEMMRRALIDGQTFEATNAFLNRSTSMMRVFTTQMEALQKYRSKGQQTIQVQHVQVNDGGQAIVGNVKTGGGDNG